MSRSWLGVGDAFPDAGAIPTDLGWVVWAYDPAAIQSGTAPATGVLNTTKLWVRKPISVTTITWLVATAGVTLTNVGVALYNSAGTLLQSSVNANGATATAFQATGVKACTIPATTLAAGVYYAGIWQTGTTIAALARGLAGGSLLNAGTTLASGLGLRYAVANTGLTTAAPTPLAQTGNAAASYWAALS